MQTRDQWKGSRNWKVMGSVAAASALGITGVALAGDSGAPDEPRPIDLEDTTSITEVTTAARSVPTTVEEAVQMGAETASVSSPLDDDLDRSSVGQSSPTSPDTPSTQASEPTQDSPASPVSPQSPASPVSQESPASPDAQESPASPASPDSPASQDSPGSADS